MPTTSMESTDQNELFWHNDSSVLIPVSTDFCARKGCYLQVLLNIPIVSCLDVIANNNWDINSLGS